MEYQVFFKKLPCSIKAFVVKNHDDSYTIFLNSSLNFEQNCKSFNHELKHIRNGDFEKENVEEIEYNAHSI